MAGYKTKFMNYAKPAAFCTALALALPLALPFAAPAAAQLALPDFLTNSGQISAGYKPLLTPPETVAMLYHIYTRARPDFEAWAKETDDYKAAAPYDKSLALFRSREALEARFSLLVPDEPVTVDLRAVLSDYSLRNEGYIIENVDTATFFPFSFAGQNYAVVPRNIQDRQWMPATGMPAKLLDDLRQSSPDKTTVDITLTLRIRTADQNGSMDIGGTQYNLLAAEIIDMAVYDADGGVVWNMDKQTALTERESEIMQLFR